MAFLTYRRRLPHWRQDGATYFVTWRIAEGAPGLDDDERDLVFEALGHFDGARYDLHARVVMNDHVHVLVTPRAPWHLSQLLHTWKSFTAHAIQKRGRRHGRFWQDEYFDRIVRNEVELLQKLHYIEENPARRFEIEGRYPWL